MKKIQRWSLRSYFGSFLFYWCCAEQTWKYLSFFSCIFNIRNSYCSCFLGSFCGNISLIPLSSKTIQFYHSKSYSESKRHGPQTTTGHLSKPPCDAALFSPTGTTYTDFSAGISRDDQPLPAHPDNLHWFCGSLTSAHSGTCTSPTWFQPPAWGQTCLPWIVSENKPA